MTDHAANTRRIAKNTVFLYLRMMFAMIVGLYTSRVVLSALGVDNFGIYNVVGGFVAMFSLISSALTSSISRFLTFELGTGNMKRLKEVFATSLLIQIAMSVIVLVVAETVGLWFVNYKLVIPADRLYAANWVFQASVFSFILGLISCPYNALIVSHERMNMFAFIGIFETLLKLAIVLFIAYSPWQFDRLIVYALLLVGVGTSLQAIYLNYTHRHFEESRVRPKFHKECWKEMSGFAGWNAIGCTAGLLKDQGVNILLNLFFGPVVNAARGLGMTVNGAVNSFAGNFLTAVKPQITKSYAAGDRAYTFSLVERGSRFGFYIIMILALPLILETQFVLTLWLKDYPAITVTFTRLVLVLSLVDILSTTLITLQTATGKIRNYQLAVGGLLLMNFPFSWIVLKLGAPAYSVYMVAIVIAIGCLFLRLLFLRKMTQFSMRQYFSNVLLNVTFTTLTSAVLPLAVYHMLPEGAFRMVTVCIASLISGAACVLFIGCSRSERAFILNKIGSLRNRFTCVRA